MPKKYYIIYKFFDKLETLKSTVSQFEVSLTYLFALSTGSSIMWPHKYSSPLHQPTNYIYKESTN